MNGFYEVAGTMIVVVIVAHHIRKWLVTAGKEEMLDHFRRHAVTNSTLLSVVEFEDRLLHPELYDETDDAAA